MNHNSMLLILDDNSEDVAHAWSKELLFGDKKIRFVTASDLSKCLKQIK